MLFEWLIPVITENPVATAAIGFPTLALLSKIADHYRRKRRISQIELQLLWMLLGVLLLVIIPWSSVGGNRPITPSVYRPDAAETAMMAFLVTVSGLIGLALVAAGMSDRVYRVFSRLWKRYELKESKKFGTTGIETIDY